jgi:hypothetical protein
VLVIPIKKMPSCQLSPTPTGSAASSAITPLLVGPWLPHTAATHGAAVAAAAAAGEDMDISPTAAAAPGPACGASDILPGLWGPGARQLHWPGVDYWAQVWPAITPSPAAEGAAVAVRVCQQECEAVRRQLAEAEDTLRGMRQELDVIER